MDRHVVYQAVPIDLNEYISSSGKSLLPTFDGNGNSRDDDGNRTKQHLLLGLAVALILSLAIVLPTVVHNHHNSEQMAEMPIAFGNDQQGEARVLSRPSATNHAIHQGERSSNNYMGPIDVEKVINDDETLFWRYDYLGDDEGVFDLVDYIQEEEGGLKVVGQDRHIEDKDEDFVMFPEYYDVVPLNDDDFEAYNDPSALGIKGDAVHKLLEGEADDADLKAKDKEFDSEDIPDCDGVDGLYQGNNIGGNLLIDDDAEPEEMA
ncbi:hypothetical protein MHU86_18951 [Fragilaria crotonensis]|nr:hypothetical protein MHU86_18951 [Fragilaria crotonensis]